MGREIRRVPLDFNWPLEKPWKGFINDRYAATPCGACEGRGDSPEARAMQDRWYGYVPFRPEDRGSTPFSPDDYLIKGRAERNVAASPTYYGAGDSGVQREAQRLADLYNSQWMHHLNDDDVAALIEGGRLMDFTHDWSREGGWAPKVPLIVPSAAEVNEWSLNGFGHDSINSWVVIKAECARMGVPNTCATCAGNGEIWPTAEAKAHYEAWESTPPPEGEGWQLWETVSEGSPVSRVYATEQEFVWGLVMDHGYSEEGARAFAKSGWAPSFVMDSERGLMSGVEASKFLDTD
jgi:hypothetical protein